MATCGLCRWDYLRPPECEWLWNPHGEYCSIKLNTPGLLRKQNTYVLFRGLLVNAVFRTKYLIPLSRYSGQMGMLTLNYRMGSFSWTANTSIEALNCSLWVSCIWSHLRWNPGRIARTCMTSNEYEWFRPYRKGILLLCIDANKRSAWLLHFNF